MSDPVPVKSESVATAVDLVSTALPVETLMRQVAIVREVRDRLMTENQHYGKVPGCSKDSLWQPGADLLLMAFNCYPEFVVASSTRTKDVVAYTIQCNLVHRPTRAVVGSCIACCSSRESKYAKTIESRSKRGDPIEPMDLENTILRMAEKRAKVGAASTMAGASEIFTTDVDEATEEKATRNLPDPTKAKAQTERMRVVQQATLPVAEPAQGSNGVEEIVALQRDCAERGIDTTDVLDPSADYAELSPVDRAKACSAMRIRLRRQQGRVG